MRRLASLAASVLRRLANEMESSGQVQRAALERAMKRHDMASHPDEAYYLDQYWHWFLPEIESRFPDRKAAVLDVGCGQGRFAIPLASWFTRGNVIGLDITTAAIDKARTYALERGLTNIVFHKTDALAFIREQPAESADLVLMTEVSFVMPSYRETIASVFRLLKPNGLLAVSFRSQYFNILHSARSRDWQSALLACRDREGHWGSCATWFSWHTDHDIRELLTEAGFRVRALYGIGVLSGIDGDPLSDIAQPSKLSSTERANLMDLEVSLAEQYANCGRYILAIAVKPCGGKT